MPLKKNRSMLLLAAIFLSYNASAVGLNARHVDRLKGAKLPYSVLSKDIRDKQGNIIEIRNGGYGSDMSANPHNPNQFYALTDRGPNASYKQGKYGKGKIFTLPDYTPRIGLFEVENNGQVRQVKTILLRRPDGTPISGLPNRAGMGGTGETPYNDKGQPILVHQGQPFDSKTNPIKLDNYGLDSEGLVALKDGTFWVSDEYGPHIVHFDANGVEIDRINPFTKDSRSHIHLPSELSNRRPNRGMEGLAITPDESTLVGIMQSTLYNPSKSVKNLNLVRIVTINLATKAIGQYIYRQEKNQNANSGLAALSKTEFLAIERDGGLLRDTPNTMKSIYRVNLAGATNIELIGDSNTVKQDPKLGLLLDGKTIEQAVKANGWGVLAQYHIKPVSKSLVVDLVKAIKYPHDKVEGLWVISPTMLGVINDDDFATTSHKGKLKQKYIDKDEKVIDGNTLYVLQNLQLNGK